MATAVSAYMSGNQAVLAGAAEKVELDTEDFDVDGEFNVTTHRFTATVAGKYHMCFQVKFAVAAADDTLVVELRKNGLGGTSAMMHLTRDSADASNQTLGGSKTLDLAVNDYIELWAENDTSNDTLVSTSTDECYMTIAFLQ
jgi:hypothetical protein